MIDLNKYSKVQIATAVAILFHTIGLVGIGYSGKSNFFISTTPVHLILMASLAIYTQHKINQNFLLGMISCFVLGFLAEWIGVHTGYLFGSYEYGNGFGLKWMGIPLLIGINWWMIMYGSGSTMELLWRKMLGNTEGLNGNPTLKIISFLIDGAALATLFDWVMEPVAIRLGYWSWHGLGIPPGFNYLCWFLLSILMLITIRKSIEANPNRFAMHLLMIQLTYFSLLRILL